MDGSEGEEVKSRAYFVALALSSILLPGACLIVIEVPGEITPHGEDLPAAPPLVSSVSRPAIDRIEREQAHEDQCDDLRTG